MDSGPKSLGLRLFRAFGTGPTELGDEHRYLQDRVRLFLRTALMIVGGFYVFLVVLLVTGVPGLALAIMSRPERLAHGAMVILLGSLLLWIRRGVLPARVLHAMESVGAVALCWLTGLLMSTVPQALSGEMMALLALTFLLVVRAVIVPSPPLRTAFVGLLGIAPLAVIAVRSRLDQGAELPFEWRTMLHWRVPVWGIVAVAITSFVSRVVYGLQTTVREVMEVGQYRLGRKLGEGAMGIVYEATHRMLRRPTAIKVLPPDRVGADTLARFEREVVQTSRLQNPSTVAIWDYGRTPQGTFYYAMELLDGLSLEELIQQDGPQPPGRVAHILRHIAESLVEAHAVGLVHRDVKPANVMLCDRGGVPDTVKVCDFGLVKELSRANEAGLTHAGIIMGTPLYLAPEAVTAPDLVDGRSDLYALGATGYALLTGTPVFTGSTVIEVVSHHMHTTPDPPSARLGQPIPARLEELVLACLSKRPEERPADGAPLLERLAALDAELGWSAGDARTWWALRGRPLLQARTRPAPSPR